MRAWAAMLLVILVAPPAMTREKITMSISPNVSFAPGHIVVRATVEKDVDNRAVQVVAESIDFYRSSTVHLEGDRAARLTQVRFRNLPEGEYVITATLLGVGDKVLATVNQSLLVNEPHVIED